MTHVLAKETLLQAVRSWLESGWKVGGPRRIDDQLVQYRLVSFGRKLDVGWLRPPCKLHQVVLLPCHERLFTFRGKGRELELEDAPPVDVPQVVIGARPCDAAALPVLDGVFNWDVADAPFNQRRTQTTVVALACTEHDAHCFCTGVGSGPASTNGADALLVPIDESQYEVRFVTDKGRALLEPWAKSSELSGAVASEPEVQFSVEQIQDRLQQGDFDEKQWTLATLACVGCGVCAHSCPACHCFDIVDQTHRGGGCRVRKWDSCQGAMYSMHASGHNPRSQQFARQRNRITHKFQTYPRKFGSVLCTGCGACTRNRPASLGVLPVLKRLEKRS